MRVNKFRAYVKHLKWLAPVEDINFKIETVEIDLSSGQGDAYEYDFDEAVLMQYTGLKDKNGVEIYEGDIVKAEHDNFSDSEEDCRPEYAPWTGKVEFSNAHYSIKTGEEYNPALFNIRIKSIEVVGNIHENPELLKEVE